MPSLFFSGTRANTGGVLAVSFNSKDQSVFLKVTKQTGWNDKINKPTFSGGETVNFKLTQDEAGDIIHAVSGHDQCGFFHTFNNETSTGNFRYYEIDDKKNAGKKIRGFGLTLKKGAFEAKIGFSLGSAERLSQYLQFALNHINSAIYAQDKKEFEEWQKKKNPPQNTAKPAKKAAPAPDENQDTDDSVVDTNVNPPEVIEEGDAEDSLNW